MDRVFIELQQGQNLIPPALLKACLWYTQHCSYFVMVSTPRRHEIQNSKSCKGCSKSLGKHLIQPKIGGRGEDERGATLNILIPVIEMGFHLHK